MTISRISITYTLMLIYIACVWLCVVPFEINFCWSVVYRRAKNVSSGMTESHAWSAQRRTALGWGRGALEQFSDFKRSLGAWPSRKEKVLHKQTSYHKVTLHQCCTPQPYSAAAATKFPTPPPPPKRHGVKRRVTCIIQHHSKPLKIQQNLISSA